jgi:hypothetical protein
VNLPYLYSVERINSPNVESLPVVGPHGDYKDLAAVDDTCSTSY